jgi:hypothetical protein
MQDYLVYRKKVLWRVRDLAWGFTVVRYLFGDNNKNKE